MDYAVHGQPAAAGRPLAPGARHRRSQPVHVVGEVSAAEVKDVKDFLNSPRMQDVFRRVNAMSTAPLEFVWLEEIKP